MRQVDGMEMIVSLTANERRECYRFVCMILLRSLQPLCSGAVSIACGKAAAGAAVENILNIP